MTARTLAVAAALAVSAAFLSFGQDPVTPVPSTPPPSTRR